LATGKPLGSSDYLLLITSTLLAGVGLSFGQQSSFGLEFVVLLIGGLLLESRAIKPGDFGLLSCAATAVLAAIVLPGLGPTAAILIALAGMALRTSMAFGDLTATTRSIACELTPLGTAACAQLFFRSKELPLEKSLFVTLVVYIAVGEFTIRFLYPRHFEAMGTRRRFLVANAVAAVPLSFLSISSPLAAFFVFPLLLIIQHAGYGLVMRHRREQLRILNEKLQHAKSEVKKVSTESKLKTREVKEKEVDRKLLEDFSVFFSRNPSVKQILENSVEALQHMLQPRKILIFSHQGGRFLTQHWSEPSNKVAAKIPADGVEDPLLAETYRTQQAVNARTWDESHRSRLVREAGPGWGLPLPNYGVIYIATEAEFTERTTDLLITIASQVALGLQSAVYRERITDALSARTKALKQLEESQAQLVQSGKMAAVGQLAAGVAHELNSPLAAVLLQIQAGQMRLEMGKVDKAKRSLEVAERATNKAQKIIEKLLYFSHLSEQQRVSVSVEKLFAETLEVVGPQLKKAGLVLTVEPCPGLSVKGDPLELQQVLTNLLLNARDAALNNAEKREPTILLKAYSGPLVTISVTDSGLGLDPATQDRIFEPFFTTKQIGEGTGLGLSISYQIAEAHQGSLEAKNDPQGGALFQLKLPSWNE
jgi:C4-dicarboxylate-specific signal transduction histidine kinase